MSAQLVDIYLRANLLLCVSTAICFAIRFVCFQKPGQNWKGWLRWMQFLVLASLTAPVLALWLPGETVSGFSEVVRVPLSEMAAGNATYQSAARAIAAVSTADAVSTSGIADGEWSVSLWIAGLFLLLMLSLGRFLYRSVHLHRTLLATDPIRRVGRVRICLSEDTSVPFSAWSMGTSFVVIPCSLLASWSDFKLAVRHELQHHRQRDTLWAQFVEGISALFILNPCVPLLRKWISEFQEFSCDEALIGRKTSFREYGSCLVRVAETALENRRLLAGTAGMAAGFENPNYFKSFLRRRIEMLRHVGSSKRNRPLQGIIGTVSVFLILTIAAVAQSNQKAPSSEAVFPGTVTVDPQIQKIAETALSAAIKRHKASLGFVVVSDPNTGRVLAVANEDRVETQEKRSPHWALSLRFGPASIAKAFFAAMAVEKGKTQFNEMHNCENSKYTIEGKLFQDWKAFDKLSTADMIVNSSNICGIKVGERLGVDGVSAALKAYGFGPGGTAEGFPEARVGELVEPRSSHDGIYTATVTTGYGNLYLSPIEVVQAFGAIANGGNLLKPVSTSTSAEPKVIRRVLSEKTAAETRQVLADVMVRGTAMKAGSKLYNLGGKTATGYSRTHVGHDTLGGDSNMAAFVGFGPVENPRVVIFTVIENPTDRKGVHGSVHAAPLFTEVAEKTLRYLKVAENKVK